MAKLAINGAKPLRTTPFPSYSTLGKEETEAAVEVIQGGCLSDFLATWSDKFYGGKFVRKLEQDWAKRFGKAHAITMNSATSGLYAAIGAAGVGPGDEVIVSPYTMSASATCALIFNAVPVFADIDEETFCLTPQSIEAVISPITKAIVVVDLLGHPVDMDPIIEIAEYHGIVVIEDAAQAYGGTYYQRPAGTLGHMGVFSLNYHKTIQSGEGGVVLTDDDDMALKLQLLRNHAEVVLEDMESPSLIDMIGFNFRMTEIEAAIAGVQLKKLDTLVEPRQKASSYLADKLSDLPGLIPPVVKPWAGHAYYLFAMRYRSEETGVPRSRLVEAIRAEGVPLMEGYVRPIYLQPIYQQRIAYGNKGCPFTCPHYKGSVNYDQGQCPVAERMHFKELVLTNLCHSGITQEDLDSIAEAFHKVFDNLDEL